MTPSNTKGMYDAKQSVRPTQYMTAPLKAATVEVLTLTDRAKQMQCWVEHDSELYSRDNSVSEVALNAVECLQTVDERGNELSLEELHFVEALNAGKAP